VAACRAGHVFCRECALENLVAQGAEAARARGKAARRAAERGEREAEEGRREAEREVGEFERVQAGLPAAVAGERGERKRKDADEDGEQGPNGKRARHAAGGSKPASSFWVPSETPNAAEDAPGDEAPPPAKAQTVCPLSAPSDPHAFSLKTLVEVHFTTAVDEADPAAAPRRTCPACRKALSNATRAVLAVPCGHVVCKPCADKFVAPPVEDVHAPEKERSIVRCYVCEADLTTAKKGKKKGGLKPGLVEIQSEGTGFAGGGKSVVQKEGVVFQC
jgi:nitric oxide synthase-interacting protein